jgi:S1-C subfamily serine protease
MVKNNFDQEVVHHVELKKHHKIVIGSFTTIVIIYMIVTAILLNGIIVKQSVNNKEVTDKLNNFEANTQNKINELTDNLMNTKKDLTSLNTQIGTIDKEFTTLKASAGDDFSGIIESSVKGVVTIRTDIGQGTGFIVNKEGYVVTNAHVVSGGNIVKAIDYQQNIIDAELIGYDNDLDIALLKIPSEQNFLELADSNKAQVGEKVIAIGNPLGLQFSVSQGIISGIHRIGPNGLTAYIQTDAALNP